MAGRRMKNSQMGISSIRATGQSRRSREAQRSYANENLERLTDQEDDRGGGGRRPSEPRGGEKRSAGTDGNGELRRNIRKSNGVMAAGTGIGGQGVAPHAKCFFRLPWLGNLSRAVLFRR